MATPTYDLLDSVTLSSDTAGLTISSIPQTYRDLILVYSNDPAAGSTLGFQFNGDTTDNYFYVNMRGDGSVARSIAPTAQNRIVMDSIGGADGAYLARATIMDYSATDKHKSVLARIDCVGLETIATAARWASTAAITSITWPYTLRSGCQIYLYGVAA